jgi:hypothetical protein
VAKSSIEVKYKAMAMVTTELYWLYMLLKNLHLPLTVPPAIRCDNLGSMALTSNLVYHARTKHIEVDYHFIREKVLNKDINLSFISTCDQPANIFTKGLTSSHFQLLRDKLLVCSPPIRLGGMLTNLLQSRRIQLNMLQLSFQAKPSLIKQITYFQIELLITRPSSSQSKIMEIIP